MHANRYKPALVVNTKLAKNTVTRKKRVVKGVLVNNNSTNENRAPVINTSSNKNANVNSHNNNSLSIRSNTTTSSAEKEIYAENQRMNFGFTPTYARSTHLRKKTRKNRS